MNMSDMIQMKNVIDERVVSFKLAALLKKAGFDECVLGFWQYTSSSSINHYNSYVHRSNTEWQELEEGMKRTVWKGLDTRHPNISAPTYEQVLDWLENKHHIIIYVVYQHEKQRWQWFADLGEKGVMVGMYYMQRYEAYDAAIKKMLQVHFKIDRI